MGMMVVMVMVGIKKFRRTKQRKTTRKERKKTKEDFLVVYLMGRKLTVLTVLGECLEDKS